MARVSPVIRHFASGELDEEIHARYDFARYATGLKACRGFLTLDTGVATRSPGTRFIGFALDFNISKLIPFVFSTGESRMIEASPNAFRFDTSDGPILNGGTPVGVITPYGGLSLLELRTLQSADRMYFVDGLNRPQRLTRNSDTDWSMEPLVFDGGPFMTRNTDQGKTLAVSNVQGTITCTANFALFTSQHVGAFFQFEDVDDQDIAEWQGNEDVAIGELRRVSGITYLLAGQDGVNEDTGLAPAPSGGVVGVDFRMYVNGPIWRRTDDPVTGVTAYSPEAPARLGDKFTSAGVVYELIAYRQGVVNSGTNAPGHLEGRALASRDGPIWDVAERGKGVAQVTGYTSSTTVTMNVIERLPESLKSGPTYQWSEGAWSDKNGWPSAIVGHEQRHGYASTPTEPRTVWMTAIGTTDDMDITSQPDGALAYTLAPSNERFDRITWMRRSGQGVEIGTASQLMTLLATNAEQGFVSGGIATRDGPTTGTAPVAPILIDNQLVHLSRDRRSVHTATFDFVADQSVPDNLARISKHMLGRGIVSMAWQQTPHRILWMVTKEGDLIGCTYYPGDQVIGWHVHPLGGDGFAVDVAVKPDDLGEDDEVWLLVRRTINGVGQMCKEVVAPVFIEDKTRQAADAWHLYCATRKQSETAFTTVEGMAYLAGETLTAWTNLGVFEGLAVAGDVVTLPAAVTSAIVGIDASADQRLDTLNLAGPASDGASDGRNKVFRPSAFNLMRTTGGTVAPITTTDFEERVGEAQDLIRDLTLDQMLDGARMVSGVVEHPIINKWSDQVQFRFQPAPGGPMTLRTITGTLQVTEA